MQYILTQDEFQELTRLKKNYEKGEIDKLQKFCTFVAENLPIIVSWDKDKEPRIWGCILTENHHGYCDQCPAKEVCPNQHKYYSK